jgi:hypothetical protein
MLSGGSGGNHAGSGGDAAPSIPDLQHNELYLALQTLTDASLDTQSRLSTLETRFRLMQSRSGTESESLRAVLDVTVARAEAAEGAAARTSAELSLLRGELESLRASLSRALLPVQSPVTPPQLTPLPPSCSRCSGCGFADGGDPPPSRVFAALESAAEGLAAAVAAGSGSDARACGAAGAALRGAASAARAAADAQAGLAALGAHVAADIAAVGAEAGAASCAASRAGARVGEMRRALALLADTHGARLEALGEALRALERVPSKGTSV